MTTDKASVAMLEALRDELRTASAEPAAGLSQRLDEVSAGLDANAMEHSGVSSPSVAPEPEYDPRPFEVRWDPTLDDGDGGWTVYLPTEHLLTYDGVEGATSDISGLTVVQDAAGNDTSWYSLDEVEADAEHVWLTVAVERNSQGVATSASAGVSSETHGDGESAFDFCVAELSRDMEDAAGRPVPVVSQSLVGALHLSSGGPEVVPDDVSVEFIPDPEGSGEPDGDEGRLQIKGFKEGVMFAPMIGVIPFVGYVFDLADGTDVTLVANGYMVHLAMEAREMLAKEGISAAVINMHTIKPLDVEAVQACIDDIGAIVTVEDHNIKGGLGSIVADVLAEEGVACALKKIGIPDTFVEFGYPEEIYPYYGMDPAGITKTALEFLGK